MNLFGGVHRQAHIENILLKHNLPKELFKKEVPKVKNGRELPVDLVRDELQVEADDAFTSFQSRNAKHVRFLLAQICLVIPPLMQSKSSTYHYNQKIS